MANTGQLVPRYETGAYLADLRTRWAPLYRQILTLLGTTATIIPQGDPYYGALDATTFTTEYAASGLLATITHGQSKTPATYTTPFKIPEEIQGLVPAITIESNSGMLTAPDAAYWSRNDAAAEAMSLVAWVNVTTSAIVKDLAVKGPNLLATMAQNEWGWAVDASDKLHFQCIDDSVDIVVTRISDAAIPTGSWVHIATTYDGSGGATAMNGVAHYVNGAVVASTAANHASYVAMENGTNGVGVWSRDSAGGSELLGRVAGGPLGFTFVQAVLTAEVIRQHYRLTRPFIIPGG